MSSCCSAQAYVKEKMGCAIGLMKQLEGSIYMYKRACQRRTVGKTAIFGTQGGFQTVKGARSDECIWI